MKQTLLFLLVFLPMLACAETVSDVQNSGCLDMTQEEKSQSLPTIVLTKEGNVLSVQLLNYETDHTVTEFNVTSNINNDDSCSVTINVAPVIPNGQATWIRLCLFNISFTVRDLVSNKFYLNCWWFRGQVELTDGEPLVLEYKVENATIDGISFKLVKVMHMAMLMKWVTEEEEVHIPSEANYEGEAYTVTGIDKEAFWHLDHATKVTVPKTIRSMDINYDSAIYANPFLECKSLKWIEVEDGCPLFSSVDGVLFAENKTMLLGYPIASPRETYTVPAGVTYIRSGAFYHNMYLQKLVIPEEVTYLGWHLFEDAKSLKELYIRGILNPECMDGLLDGMDTTVAVYVQPSEVEKFQAIYNGPVYPLPEQSSDNYDYIPFVEPGKQWQVVRTVFPSNNPFVMLEQYMLNEEVVKDGKTYLKLHRSEGDMTVIYDAGLFREENRRVYKYDEIAGKETMLYDFSLKEGDIFTYEDFNPTVKCKVLKLGWLEDGPKIALPSTNPTDTLDFNYRRLRTWTIGVDNGAGEYVELITWVEGVGALENLFCPFCTGGGRYSLAYIERKDAETDYDVNNYLPFSFYNRYGPTHGCNLPTGAENNEEDEWSQHHLTYELEGDRLHVYGDVFTQCGPNNYAYFIEKTTDDPMVRKIEFKIQEVTPVANCMALHATNFYVPGFDPNLNYIVVDNQGEEHPVINKTPQNEYRPFIEDGKVWTVYACSDANPDMEPWREYFYFAGDTIVGGQTCKQMKKIRNASEENWVNGVFTPANSPQEYVGAWYEQDKKVYFARAGKDHPELFYDFTLCSNDTIYPFGDPLVPLVVNKISGGLPGFKGTYYEFRYDGQIVDRWLEGVGNIYHPAYNITWTLDGFCGGIFNCRAGDEVIYYNIKAEDPYVMNARKRFDFTHTTKSQPKAPIQREKSDAGISSSERKVARPKVKVPRRSEAEQSLYGEYNNLLLDINLDPLSEAYLVRITDETGKVVYEKAINAGSIVALNIDISAYAAGRYTVTVENSQETFTGEFETQTTGIRDALRLNNNEEIKNKIYNLQGQRLSSLQRGLNIVNGQKVYVK